MADYVGDSYYLAKVAAKADKGTIVFCGVRFMGESAKILNPGRRVLLPDDAADCPMAHMASAARIPRPARRGGGPCRRLLHQLDGAAEGGERRVRHLVQRGQDRLRAAATKTSSLSRTKISGHFVHAQVPGKKFYYSGGYCPVHAVSCSPPTSLRRKARAARNAPVLAHPECTAELARRSPTLCGQHRRDHRARRGRSRAAEFILGTEPGVLRELARRCPGKRFVARHARLPQT